MERPDWETYWEPLKPEEVAEQFRTYPGRWWIAGGWAIEFFAGAEPREHSDVDVAILRDELPLLHETLIDWELWACRWPGKYILHRWLPHESLPDVVHDIWIRKRAGSPWVFQLMVYDQRGENWVYRRDRRFGGPIAELGWKHGTMPVLNPEVQLLFKSRAPREKDEFDFAQALPVLSPARKTWLRNALQLTDPGNPWLQHLQTEEPQR